MVLLREDMMHMENFLINKIRILLNWLSSN